MNRVITKFITSFLAVLILIISPLNTVSAYNDIKNKINNISEKLLSMPTPNVNSIGGEWEVLGLSRADKITDNFKTGYYENAFAYIKAKGSNRLHKSKSTDNSRMIIALTSIGIDAQNIGGYDITEPLADFSYVKAQGINGVIWALIALDTVSFDIYTDNEYNDITTREKLIDNILSRQLETGGWSLSGTVMDVDITAMVVTALARYYNIANVKTAIDNAISVLSEAQHNDGSFGTSGISNAESCAQVVNALSSLGIDANVDTRFKKNGNSALDGMMNFSVDGGFSHTNDNVYNQMATEQCFYALVAYQRFIEGKRSLFDMRDLPQITNHDVNYDGKLNINDCTETQRILAQMGYFSAIQKLSADFDNSGSISVGDVTLMQRYLTR